jgi:hypothetical protein
MFSHFYTNNEWRRKNNILKNQTSVERKNSGNPKRREFVKH